MGNILHVTEYLKNQIRVQGGDPHRETLDFVRAKTGEPYFVDSFGEYWRAYHFVENAYALEETSSPQDFYESAVAFGHFQKMLAKFPADSLTDYLSGDTYFKIAYPEHNLDRARTQLKLVADMEAKWDQMEKIVEKYL